jgi:hypothetical protein
LWDETRSRGPGFSEINLIGFFGEPSTGPIPMDGLRDVPYISIGSLFIRATFNGYSLDKMCSLGTLLYSSIFAGKWNILGLLTQGIRLNPRLRSYGASE